MRLEASEVSELQEQSEVNFSFASLIQPEFYLTEQKAENVLSWLFCSHSEEAFGGGGHLPAVPGSRSGEIWNVSDYCSQTSFPGLY